MKLETSLLTASLTFRTEQTRQNQETLPALKPYSGTLQADCRLWVLLLELYQQ